MTRRRQQQRRTNKQQLLDDMDNHKFKSSPGQNKTTPSTVERNIRDQTSETNIGK